MRAIHLAASGTAARASQLYAFAQLATRTAGRELSTYGQLHDWACAHTGDFWKLLLEWSQIRHHGNAVPALVGESVESATFFPQVALNYAANLLRASAPAADAAEAIVFRCETGERQAITRRDLRGRALALAGALRTAGIVAGDRVAALARHTPQAIEACLGATALGAAWSSVAPDLGTDAILGRFSQLEPKLLFAHTEFVNHGVRRSLAERVRALTARLPSLRELVVLGGPVPEGIRAGVRVTRLEDLQAVPPLELDALPQLPFDHPLFILFSSGTTGAPKCIVHGAGGTLLEHVKEHRLHTDLRPADVLYFHTSCGWMMWNWLVSALASGVRIVLYDGSASYPDATALLRVIDEERVTVFGTSPAYLQLLRDSGLVPREIAGFGALRAILSTGSILYEDQFDWIRDSFKHVPIHSISGGTDIVGCFVLGNPLLPVYRGDSQSVSLGMDVRAMTDEGPLRVGTGDLVCLNPFPSRPVGIWGDVAGRRFHDTYFGEHPGVWNHGDRIELTAEGSARILGRTDGVMKIRGVRIGPAELYGVVLQVPGIEQAMAVEQTAPREPGGSRIVLLIVLGAGATLDRDLTLRLKRELSQRASPVHVPAVIAQVAALPQTLNGKFSERAARDAVNGRVAANRAALKNPECLDEILANPALQPPI